MNYYNEEQIQEMKYFIAWKKIAKALDMQVYGWTYLSSATFIDKNNQLHVIKEEMRKSIEKLIKKKK